MGRHSRRGSTPKGDTADAKDRRRAPGSTPSAGPTGPTPPGPGRGRPLPPEGGGASGYGVASGHGGPGHGGPVQGGAPHEGAPHGGPRSAGGTPAHGFPTLPDGTPAHGFPRLPDGTPAHGFPTLPDGTPAHGFPTLADGTPAHGFPRLPDGTPAHGTPRFPGGGTPAHGGPRARGGHPEQREPGGAWGELRGPTAGAVGYGPLARPGTPGRPGQGPGIPRPRHTRPTGPRQEYLDAFGDEEGDLFVPRRAREPAMAAAGEPYASVTRWETAPDVGTDPDDAPPTGEPAVPAKGGGKGRTFTGIAAAAVTTVLAVVVAGQVTDQGADDTVGARSQARDARDAPVRANGGAAPSVSPSATPLTYEQKMGKVYALSPTLEGPGTFDAIPGVDKAPGKGQKYTYRVDVEQGLGLDGELFAEAVQKTLNDNRSWAHNGGRTFERIHSGDPDFVITLASPGTTADWCARSGLDTTIDNVSCDSAATERVMINAYRWARGSTTYGDQIHAYRQMLINHEIGHRLGYSHVTCDKEGDLAPVMQQQTKFLEYDGIRCRPNPWPYPKS
ncbi:DUF3152 domain-containing protein [Streptomyces sp. B93]|uniref:DUF3152 domain-containing protein n=1 Tax=Streptomyces sp. B93 TaxID=2824875 RepID=UPI001B387A24|nr:DUF3152 domain-containing protein [Streptomyces sp. B93]MBQ1091639.1 DUF3152 domain-containing protein [Streptomyces sp. B93]